MMNKSAWSRICTCLRYKMFWGFFFGALAASLIDVKIEDDISVASEVLWLRVAASLFVGSIAGMVISMIYMIFNISPDYGFHRNNDGAKSGKYSILLLSVIMPSVYFALKLWSKSSPGNLLSEQVAEVIPFALKIGVGISLFDLIFTCRGGKQFDRNAHDDEHDRDWD